ncbi:RNA methyltransferase family protein [Perilla frutescens var. frutescens]|nr:RNA methyltransferase family protein [Perilla frutescens var. frutescens]
MMKSSSFTRATLSLSSILSLRPKPGRVAFCSAAKPKPQTPLYLRPPEFRATLSDLRKWHIWAKTEACNFSAVDGGAESSFLRRELRWLVEDAVEQPGLVWEEMNEEGGREVAMRACLEELYGMWKERIEERRPFQYVVGCEHWRDLILSVEEGVLIPRPETEVIVDLVDAAVKADEELRDGYWADLGTGSGALAIAVARVLGGGGGGGGGRVAAVDLSPIAVAVASYNVERYNLQERICVRLGSWFDPLEDLRGELSGLVSNPPYIPSDDIDGLQAEVSRHEPRLALDGGPNGMDDLIHLCNGAASMLKPRAFFAFETNGEMQSKFLVDYMDTKMKGSFCRLNIISDFAGIQRFVTGYRSA